MEDWSSRGFYGKKISQYVEEDLIIKNFLRKKLTEASVSNIDIEHFANKTVIIINTARPGLIIGRGGGGVEQLKKLVEKELAKKEGNAFKKEIKIEIREIKNPWLSASLVGQWMAQQIEKRVPYRQVLKRTLEKVTSNREVKGARVEVSGRLDGIEIARKEWLRIGRLPRQTIRSDIDYAQTEAHCTYGAVGIKVWIYKGEKFE